MAETVDKKSVLKKLAVGGAGVTIPSLVTALVLILPDIYDDMKAQRKKHESGYETVAPAVVELQDAFHDLADEIDDMDDDHEKSARRIWMLEQRVNWCENNIETLSRGRVQAPTYLHPSEFSHGMMSVVSDGYEFLDPRAPSNRRKKPRRKVPTSLHKAHSYQQSRDRLKCDENDPLCGELE